MAARRTRREALIVRDALTEEEQRTRTEDMQLKRCEEIKKERREREKAKRAAKQALTAKRKRARYLARCKKCPAMKSFLKNGKKKS